MSLLTPPATDTIYLSSLSLTTTIAPGDVWGRTGKQTPVTLSVRLQLPSLALAAPASNDSIAQTISYGVLAKALTTAIAQQASFGSLKMFAAFVCDRALAVAGRKDVGVEVEAVLGEGLLLAEGFGVVMEAGKGEVMLVRRLRVACVVGVNLHERLQKQWVVIDLRLWDVSEEMWITYSEAVGKIVKAVEGSEYLTIETLATEVARMLCVEFGAGRVTVAVEKPSALAFAKGSGVEITREKGFFAQSTAGDIECM